MRILYMQAHVAIQGATQYLFSLTQCFSGLNTVHVLIIQFLRYYPCGLLRASETCSNLCRFHGVKSSVLYIIILCLDSPLVVHPKILLISIIQFSAQLACFYSVIESHPIVVICLGIYLLLVLMIFIYWSTAYLECHCSLFRTVYVSKYCYSTVVSYAPERQLLVAARVKKELQSCTQVSFLATIMVDHFPFFARM